MILLKLLLASGVLVVGAERRQAGYCLPPVRPCPSFDYDAYYDLENGYNISNNNVQVIVPLEGRGCSAQGVLKLKLAKAKKDPNRRRVLVDLFFTAPTGWVFNLGDSSTNDGNGGDAGTQSWDAEVHGITQDFFGYLSDVGGSGLAFNLPIHYSTRLTLVVGNGQANWYSDLSYFNYYSNPGFFSLNGQPDSTGPKNYNLYLGINRVIFGPGDLIGRGLCKVGIKFLPEH